MTKGQKKLRDLIRAKHRRPTFEEAFDIYTEYVMRTSYHCYLTIDGVEQMDYGMTWLQDKAMDWLRRSLGSLVCQGELSVY